MTDNEIRDRLLNAFEWLEKIKGTCPSDENYINADIIQKFINCYQSKINRQQAEIERYKGVIKLLEKDVANAKSETVKEFAERLCEGRVSNDPVVIAVKTELKMTEQSVNYGSSKTEGNG